MPTHEDIAYLDATELARLIRARELSPVEVVRALLERADAVNGAVNALVTFCDDAEERARAAEAAVARGERLGPLHGVPFTVKDTIDTGGVRTTRGSLLFADHVPREDATTVARLKAAGGILLAKTNTPEFALWWETGNRVFGLTRNPWNLERTAGGSSGGEAAAVAAGLSPLGLGSDLGGSIRAPAHYCGVAGLKPTHGRVPLTGNWPETILRFMHVGPLGRSVRDVALATSILAGPDGHDWYALPVPPPEPAPPSNGLEGLRVGWLAEHGFGPVDPDVAAAVERAAVALAELGANVEHVAVAGLESRDTNALTLLLYGGESAPYFEGVVAGRHDELHPMLRRRLETARPSLGEYVAAEGEVEGLRHDLAEFFRRDDILLCPTGVVPAHEHEAAEIAVDGQMFHPRTVLRATIPFDLTGSPAISVPFGFSRDGLPIGVQVVGRHFDEASVFQVGAALEEAGGASGRRPAL